MLRTALNPHHWCVLRWKRAEPHKPGDEGVRTDGCRGLAVALAKACDAINDQGARRVTIFEGQPSDGARVVARIDLDGLPDANALDALRKAEAFLAGFEDDCTQDGLPATLADVRAAIAGMEA